jgi:hypothetical protein
MKKYIFTESQLKNILDTLIQEENQISEQSIKPVGKFTFAFNNHKTDFQGEIKRDGYLYISTEMGRHFKVGPLSKVPKIGQAMVTIDKKGTIENVYFGKTLLQFVPNFIVKQIG